MAVIAEVFGGCRLFSVNWWGLKLRADPVFPGFNKNSENEPNDPSNTLSVLLNIAIKAKRDRVLKADHYEKSKEREAFRNGYKDKTVSTWIDYRKLKVPAKSVWHGKKKHRDSPFKRGGKWRMASL